MQPNKFQILFVTEESAVEQRVTNMLRDAEDCPFSVRKMAVSPHIATHLSFCKWDAILWDLTDSTEKDLDALRNVCFGMNAFPVVGLVSDGQNQIGRKAMRVGAVDYLPTNVLSGKLLQCVLLQAIERNRSNTQNAGRFCVTN